MLICLYAYILIYLYTYILKCVFASSTREGPERKSLKPAGEPVLWSELRSWVTWVLADPGTILCLGKLEAAPANRPLIPQN